MMIRELQSQDCHAVRDALIACGAFTDEEVQVFGEGGGGRLEPEETRGAAEDQPILKEGPPNSTGEVSDELALRSRIHSTPS